MEDDLILPIDALVRSFKINRSTPHTFFLGAGASISSNIPSAQMCIWEWKRDIFLTNNPGLEEQFAELSLPGVRQKIQSWLDSQGKYPSLGSPEEYGFYIEACFPIPEDRRGYFQEKVTKAKPHIGYSLLCHLAEDDLVRSVWSTNFDGLVSRVAFNHSITPIEIGIDTQDRVARLPKKGELQSVSLHGDYRYDHLKNTTEEIQSQEKSLQQAFENLISENPLVICGYSGRDESVMESIKKSYDKSGSAPLYWCGYSDNNIPRHIEELIKYVRSKGRPAFFIPTQGFDDFMIRVALHCLEKEQLARVKETISKLSPEQEVEREKFQVPDKDPTTLIKSNAFEVECPAEVFQFELKEWPDKEIWKSLREMVVGKEIVVAPFRGKILALGALDEIKNTFGENIKGSIERTPITNNDLRYEDGIVISLFREALTRSMASAAGIQTDSRKQLWFRNPLKKVVEGGTTCLVYESVDVFLRTIGLTQHLMLKPSLKILDDQSIEVQKEIANPIKLRILGYQHNKPFNQALEKWRVTIFQQAESRNVFEFPVNCGSTFKFQVRKSPIFSKIESPRFKPFKVSDNIRPLIKHSGFELKEPELVFSNKEATNVFYDNHPIRGIINNRPFDFSLTQKGLSSSIKVGVVCPKAEGSILVSYLNKIHQSHQPRNQEKDYLFDFPGFENAFRLPIELPRKEENGWVVCPEPQTDDSNSGALELANNINRSIDTLLASYSPSVILVFIPNRWSKFRGFRTENERFDLHDFVKAYCVQKGIASQFLEQDTLSNAYECRIWWWLSLAFYVKSMRTPWVLSALDEDSAFVGLGFSVDHTAAKGSQVVLGCSHIYSSRGEGLQYRLTKVENPIFRGGNPYMSKDDARRLGETIRHLFYESRMKLPDRVVIHKQTPFIGQEKEGLHEGLSGVKNVDLLEIHADHALRYVSSIKKPNGKFDEDNYPVARSTTVKLDDYLALLWVHGATSAVNPKMRYFQGKRRIPAPLIIKRHSGRTDLKVIAEEILGLSKMNWNTFDLYSKLPATVHSSGEIARIGSLLQRFGASSYDYRLFI